MSGQSWSRQPWIFSERFDLAFILAPSLLVTLAAFAFGPSLSASAAVAPLLWLVLIVGVDVGHVYSTIFRTYLDKHELAARPLLYIMTPILAWLGGSLLYGIDAMLFWRVLAYAAVFHFVRQQYGFMMIYGRRERGAPAYARHLDKVAIYTATLYPLLYWHTHRRSFEWFVPGDFMSLPMPALALAGGALAILVFALYIAKEVALWRATGIVNIPRNLLLFGTAGSWLAGIVLFDNDLVFTATNVIAHGVPYIALIWGYGRNQVAAEGQGTSFLSPSISRLFGWRSLPLFLAVLALFAYAEEALWDGFVWREHGGLFPGFSASLPDLSGSDVLTWLVPLLAVPQATHYVLDAFIWRMHVPGTNWRRILFLGSASTHAPEVRPEVVIE